MFKTTDYNNNCTDINEKHITPQEYNLETGGNNNNIAQWSIGKNEVARKISEIDFINIGTISSIIIQPGVTAVIYVDGKELLQLNSGIYRFASDTVVTRTIESTITENNGNESKGITGWLKTKLKSLVKLFLGRKNNEENNIGERERVVTQVISKVNEKSLIAVYLKRDINFPILFGSEETSDGDVKFAPLKIRTRLLDAEIGVHMFAKIVDFQTFISGYLASDKSVTTSDIEKNLSVYVHNVLQEELRYEEINDFGISDEAKSRICNRMQTIVQYAPGIELVRVAEISCSNEAISRFRSLSQELYCNEKELDFLHRTNEFKNRLARENNAVAVTNARNDAELDSVLRGINRDKLLNEEEFEAFKDALKLKRLNRGTDFALQAIRTKEKLKSAELESKTSLIMKEMESQARISEMVYAKELRDIRFQREKKREELNIKREEDIYLDERERHRQEIQKRQLDMAMGIRERMSQFEHENMDRNFAREQNALDKQHAREQDSLDRSHMRNMEIMAHEREMRKDSYSHEEIMSNIRKNYTEGQLMAEKIDSMDAAAQVEFAKSLGSRKNDEIAEAKMEMYDNYMKRIAEDRDRMYEFAKEAMRMNVAAAGVQVSNIEAMRDKYRDDAERYREDAYYQQNRTDRNMDRALDYTTRVTTAGSTQDIQDSVSPADNSLGKIYCPYCNTENDSENVVCSECGYNLK